MEPNYIEQNKKGLLEKIIFVILLGISFLSPIFFVPALFIPVQFGTSLLFAFGAIVSILLYIGTSLFKGSIILPSQSKYILSFIFLVPIVYALAGIANGFSRMSFIGYTFDISTVGFVALAFFYMYLVSIFFKDGNRIFYGYFAFLVSAILLSLFVVLRMIFGADFISSGIFGSITSTMVGSWNNVGIFFGAGVILSLLTYEMVNVSKVMKILLTLALLSSLFFLSLVNFGVIWVIIAITTFLFILYRINSKEDYVQNTLVEKLKRTPKYSLIVLLISIVFSLWGGFLGGKISEKFGTSNIEIRPSFSVTMEVAKNTIKEKPLFGSGPNTFLKQWHTYRPTDIVATNFWNIDFSSGIGLIPTFLVTTGIFGIISWVVFLGFYIYLGIKSMFMRIEDYFKKYLIVSAFFTSLYLWVMSFVYVSSTVIFILTFFFTGLFFAGLYMAGIFQTTEKTFNNTPRQGFLSALGFVVIIVACIGLGYGLFKNSKSLWYFQKSAYALNTERNISESERYMVRAIETVPLDIYYRAMTEVAIIKINAILSQDPKNVKIEDVQTQFQNALSNAIIAGVAAKDTDPNNYLNWTALGLVYEAVSNPQLKVEGAYDGAVSAYTKALERNPKNPSIYLLFSRLAVTAGNLTKAKEYALQAIQLKNNYLDAYFLLSQIEVEQNNLKGAIESAQVATVIDPTNSALFFQLGLLKYNDKDFDGAISALEKAIEITPDYANAKYFLGLSYDEVGEKDKALLQFEEIKKFNQENEVLDLIISNLKSNKKALSGIEQNSPESGRDLPVRENVR